MKMTRMMRLMVVGVASLALQVACSAQGPAGNASSQVLGSTTNNRQPVSAGSADLAWYGNYANYEALKPRAGTPMAFAASYGTGGEAGQANGKIVARNNGFYFQPEENVTTQMMLAPGQADVSYGQGQSLWEMGSYLQMAARIAVASIASAQDPYNMYDKASMAMVSFDGNTAGQSVHYDQALEVSLSKSGVSAATSQTKIYIVKDVGVVGLEFMETGDVAGTFKMYLGRSNQ